MKDGSYPKAFQKGCSFLADAINLSQKGITTAKVQIDKNLDRMRQVIHEKTAPKAAPKAGGSPKSKVQSPKSKGRRAKQKAAKEQDAGSK